MDAELYKIADLAIRKAYKKPQYQRGSSQWSVGLYNWNSRALQVLAICGSNGPVDWFWNFFLASWDRFKIGSYIEAWRIKDGTWGAWEWMRKAGNKAAGPVAWAGKVFGRKKRRPRPFRRIPGIPLMVVVHSKSGPTGHYWMHKGWADYCVSFCPARGCRGAIPIDNTVIFRDPDDPVPKLGAVNFNHPVGCEWVNLPDDPGLISIGDHMMDHISAFVRAM